MANLTISPKTKVGELLDAFPQLEPFLLELSPAFAKLKNPILRKTVARIATLQQAAVVGGLETGELINLLRGKVGQTVFSGEAEGNDYLSSPAPDWFDDSKICRRYNAIPVIHAGGSPMQEILSLANNLQPGELLEVTTPFVPAPILDMLRVKGFLAFSVKKENEVMSYFRKLE